MKQDDIPTTENIPRTQPISEENMVHPPDLDLEPHTMRLAQQIRDKVDDGWSVGSVTITPIEVSRDRRRLSEVVHGPVLKVHFRLAILANRGPHPAAEKWRNVLPLLIGAADLPIEPEHPDEVGADLRGGLRYRGLLAMPPTPLGSLAMWKHKNSLDEFLREGTGVERIDFEVVDPTMISDAMRSCLATIYRGALDLEEALLALPKARRRPIR